MKRYLIYLIGAILSVAFAACTADDVDNPMEVELTIQLSVASDMNTRASRPLESVNNAQHVTDVRVYVFRSDAEDGPYSIYQPTVKNEAGEEQTIEYIDVEGFKKKGDTIYDKIEFEKYYVVIKPKLPEGYYKLLAIGVDEDLSLFDVITPESTWDNIVKEINEDDSPITSECFSGYSETVHVSSTISKNFISIELKRCVAGVLLYVKNINPTIDGKTIDNIKLTLSGYSKSTDIVNRKWASDAEAEEVVLAEINKRLPNEELDGETCYYTGRFILPSNTGNLDNPTMQMVFYSGNDKVTTKNVKLINADDDDYETPNLNEDGTCYNIIANRLYCIGFRSKGFNEPVDLEKEEIEAKL